MLTNYNNDTISGMKGVDLVAADTKKSIVVRVEPEFHQELKMFTVSKGMTIQEYVIELIKKDMEKNKK